MQALSDLFSSTRKTRVHRAKRHESTLQPYQHEPLRNIYGIRLLKLKTERVHGTLSCSIEHFSRTDPLIPSFRAVSYCWGDPSPTHAILLNEHRYAVHKNLWLVLDWLWRRQMLDYFWTDCLSLDQHNAAELGQQIPMMKHVYTSAEEVFMFLGFDQPEEKALDALKIETASVRDSDHCLEAAQTLTSNPFWQRIWIIQEATLASTGTLIAGNSKFSLDSFLTTVLELEKDSPSSGYTFAKPVRRIHELRQQRRRRDRPSLALFRLLEEFRDCQCTNPIDRIYGLSSLVVDPVNLVTRLELRQNKPAQQVFWNVVLEYSFPIFNYHRIIDELAPMYQEPTPMLYLESLMDFSIDPTTSVLHRGQARYVLLAVLALNKLARTYRPFRCNQTDIDWTHAFRSLHPTPIMLQNPEICSPRGLDNIRRHFQLALDIASSIVGSEIPSKVSPTNSEGWWTWEYHSPSAHADWEIGSDEYFLEFSPHGTDYLVSPSEPDRVPILKYPGGQVGVIPINFTTALRWVLCAHHNVDPPVQVQGFYENRLMFM
ncbi:heterokaryon incompatibility protein-domain-containing protein [Lophiotrema nucula]|uniref:Heterokaryon incompatibility protein-domain-containing protein n=1 Tax=Lophiotrema nucula TaxID=690887 RepID=A0A6A5YR41_9PLEO|nr:heterokaryon incompatibility protein-domain-containing protein [Lophiotrema nucula]